MAAVLLATMTPARVTRSMNKASVTSGFGVGGWSVSAVGARACVPGISTISVSSVTVQGVYSAIANAIQLVHTTITIILSP